MSLFVLSKLRHIVRGLKVISPGGSHFRSMADSC